MVDQGPVIAAGYKPFLVRCFGKDAYHADIRPTRDGPRTPYQRG